MRIIIPLCIDVLQQYTAIPNNINKTRLSDTDPIISVIFDSFISTILNTLTCVAVNDGEPDCVENDVRVDVID